LELVVKFYVIFGKLEGVSKMSRIGKLPITIPENVDINYTDSEITVKGKFGTLQTKFQNVIDINQR
jgi:ribosomal protein L6P/L9E